MTEEELRDIVNNNLVKFCAEYKTSNKSGWKSGWCNGCPLLADNLCLKNIIKYSSFADVKRWKHIKGNHK